MILTDLTLIFRWWLILFLIGITFLPFTYLIFPSFFDKAYIFSKIIGLLLISYIVWVVASLHIVGFSLETIIAIFILFLTLNLFILFKQKSFRFIKNSWRVFLLEEGLLTIGLIFWSFIRVHEPSIHSLEKFMDFGFINSILRSEFLPPKDLWLAPHTINYYYFGHLITAILTKISGIDPTITYNLMVATIFALTFSASFSISSNLYFFLTQKVNAKVFLTGFLGAFLVSLSGNLQTIYLFFENYTTNPLPFWQLKPMFNSSYWYPNATRFIPNTIHEFPLYSFVVSDLHGHVLNIPTVLLILSIEIIIFYNVTKIYHYFLLGLILGIATMTNTLDGPIYLLLTLLVLFFRNIKQMTFLKSLFGSLKIVVGLSFLTYLSSLLFWMNFKPFASSIGVLCAPQFLINIGKLGPFLFEANHCTTSPLWMLGIVYGFFYIVFGGFLLILLKKGQHILKTDYLILIFILFGTLIILIPEIIYFKDIYPVHYRANTVFKFGYQAFIVLSIASSYMIINFFERKHSSLLKMIYGILISLCFCLVAIYPYFAVSSYYNNLKNYQGFDGIKYLQDLYPSDYNAILWLSQNIKGQPIILEAQGDSYTDYARISSNTGLPTVMGWTVHEWLWRGSPDEGTKRIADIKTLYETNDIKLTADLIKKYNISYIFVGDLERQKYPTLNLAKFSNLGQIIFQDNQTIIFKIK